VIPYKEIKTYWRHKRINNEKEIGEIKSGVFRESTERWTTRKNVTK